MNKTFWDSFWNGAFLAVVWLAAYTSLYIMFKCAIAGTLFESIVIGGILIIVTLLLDIRSTLEK